MNFNSTGENGQPHGISSGRDNKYNQTLAVVRQEMMDLTSLSSLKRISFRIRGREELLFLVRDVSLKDTQSFLYTIFSAHEDSRANEEELTKPCSPIIQEFSSLTFIRTPRVTGPKMVDDPENTNDYTFNLVFLYSAYEKYSRPALWFRDVNVYRTPKNPTNNLQITGLHGVMLCNKLLIHYFETHRMPTINISKHLSEYLSREISIDAIDQWKELRTPVTSCIESLLARISLCPRNFNPLEPEFDLTLNSEDHPIEADVSQCEVVKSEVSEDILNTNKTQPNNVVRLAYFGVMFKLWQRYDGCKISEIPTWLTSVFEETVSSSKQTNRRIRSDIRNH